MERLYKNCRALFDTAFPGEDKAWSDALFAYALPHALRVIREGDRPKAMLFALPYDIVLPGGCLQAAKYLYAVSTDPACRGQGLAKRLLNDVAAEGAPVFLRPMSASLFDFYKNAGLSPVSPYLEMSGESEPADEAFKSLTAAEYLAARKDFLKPPYAVPTADFLSLGFSFGGAVALDGKFAAYYERREDEIFFKEWLGDTAFAPRVAAYLGAARYKLRTPCGENEAGATPFGMAVGCPPDLCFLIALD